MHSIEPVTSFRHNFFELWFIVNDLHLKNSLQKTCITHIIDGLSLELLNHIRYLGNTRSEVFRSFSNSFLAALLAHICLKMEHIDAFTLNKQLIDMSKYSNLTKSIIIYVDEHFNKRITLNQIAKDLGNNKSYICTLFKKETGITINNYMNLVRINMMIQLLYYTDMNISTLSKMCGFQSVSHFNRTFRQFTGYSPSEYKQVLSNHSTTLNSIYAEGKGKLSAIIEDLGFTLDSFNFRANRVNYSFSEED